jgi:hypothetical protein
VIVQKTETFDGEEEFVETNEARNKVAAVWQLISVMDAFKAQACDLPRNNAIAGSPIR